MDLAPLALLSRRLHVERAEIEGVLLTLFPATAPAAAPPENNGIPGRHRSTCASTSCCWCAASCAARRLRPSASCAPSVAGSWSGTSIEASKLALESPEGTIESRGADRRARSKAAATAGGISLARGRAPMGRHAGERPARTKPSSSAPHSICRVKVRLAGTLAPARTRANGDAWRAHLAVERFDPHPLITSDAFRYHGPGAGRGRRSRRPGAARRVDARRESHPSRATGARAAARNCCR